MMIREAQARVQQPMTGTRADIIDRMMAGLFLMGVAAGARQGRQAEMGRLRWRRAP